MRTHGWGGAPPTDDAEARARIIDAAMTCVDRHGARTNLSDVAAELGITRQTVYRYFPSTDELFTALAQVAAASFIDEVVARVRRITEPAEVVIEALAYTIEALPDDRYLTLLLRTGRSETFTHGVTSTVAMNFGRTLLARTGIDWAALGYDDRELDELVELQLRLIQSLAIDPPDPPRRGRALRIWLRRWLAPAIAFGGDPRPARTDDAGVGGAAARRARS
jgi:AcrR family transcriptional regulator